MLINARLALGSIKEMNDEDHVPSRGATAYAIFRDPRHGSCGNRQSQQSSASRLAFGSRLQGYRIVAREIATPAWSFACMNDQGPQQCEEPMWVYGSPDYLAQFRNSF